jgi:NitT/TauT family transport system ATP-binding protein
MSDLVRLAGVSKVFRTGSALQDIDLAIAPGEFVSLLGPSGCGKSTLLRILAGLLPADAGQVCWPQAGAGTREALGFVFQEPTLLPWTDVRANVALPLRLQRLPRLERERRVDEALELVALTGFARAYPRELSGGMQMRVSLARALVARPRLLLLDEPFAALDELTRFKLNDDLLRLWAHEQLAVVFVTHSVFESVYLAQRVVVMTPRPGRIATQVMVDLPAPRRPELRTSPPYAECCREVSQRLLAALAA